MKTTVTARKQVSIPAEVCYNLGIKPGWELDWKMEEGRLSVRPIPPPRELAARIRRRAQSWKIPPAKIRLALKQEREAERDNDARKGLL